MLYKELDSYFRIRFEELLNKSTPDSYRVKNHNPLSCMEELVEIIDGWQKYRIQNPETVIFCAQECKNFIEEDKWLDFSFYDRDLFKKDIEDYIKSLPDNNDKRESTYELSSKLRYTCRKCIDINSTSYADNLFSYLLQEINRPGDMDKDKRYKETMRDFDKALSTLCCEFIRLGHSKNHLYLKASKLNKEEGSIEELGNQLLTQKETLYEVIYKIQSNTYIEACRDEYGFKNDMEPVKQRLTNQKGELPYKNFLDNKGKKLFKIFEVYALDTYAAIKKSKDFLALLLDTLHLRNDSNFGKFENRVLVISPASTDKFYSEIRESNYQLDGIYKMKPSVSIQLKSRIDDILGNHFVKDDVKERLKSAMRHLRMANDSEDLELRFINYWIALEFIFSSPISHENTFLRIKKHLVNVLCYSYISRNVHYLDKLLHSDGVLSKDNSLTTLSDNEWGILINQIRDKRTQYRLCEMKSHLHSEDNIEKYIHSHRLHLEWHLSRIYRMRNELIHEAALKQDIEGTTSNLRFYLVFVLNQMITFFHSEHMEVGINDFFHYYENKTNVIFSKKERDYVLKAEYEMDLIR